uniref:Methyltransferase 4, N6-adenosine n=1 Tax=Amphiprion percula TaxID=161767 RepID=A0A3P8T843_AMPPE
MSVLFHSIRGWFVDPRSLIDRGYSRCIQWRETQKSHVKCRFKRQCFQILKSYYNVPASAAVDGGNKEMLQKTEKPPKVTAAIETTDKNLYFIAVVETDAVKEPLPSQECRLAALCEMAKELPLVDDEEQECCSQSLVAEDGCSSHVDLFSGLTENRTDRAAVVTLMGEEYVIPPHTAFLLSDFTRIQPLVHYGRMFDLVVMDPPWENKSVKRSRRSNQIQSTFILKRLPVPLLASPNCLVVTWVTNRPSHLRFVRDELYPHWGVEVVAEWFWVKVTTSGQFVFPLDSPHKKPYEMLVLGRYRPSVDLSTSHDHPLPHCFLLTEVLKPYVGAEAKCLELFARSLQPGWTSWGNEVLKFQHTSYFTLTPADDGVDVSKDETTEANVQLT